MTEQTVEETKTPQEPEVQKPEEIDFDRIKNGDEDYTRQVNERLAKEAVEAPAPESQPDAPTAEAAPAAPEEDFVTFDDGDPIYKGQPFKVKKSDLKAYVQKGRHLEVKLSELAPYVNVVKSNPELAEAITRAAHDPAGAEQLRRIGEALKGGRITQQVEDDLADLDLPGLNKDDVQAVAKIQRALQQRESRKREEAEQKRMQEELARRDYEATSMVNGLRAVEGPLFDQVRPKMQERLQQLRSAVDNGVIDEQQFNQFVIGLTDPTAVDDTGKPLFVRFYNDIKAEMTGTPPAASAPAPVARPAPTNNVRLSPGTATSARSAGEPDWKTMSQSEFDRRIAEKLAAL